MHIALSKLRPPDILKCQDSKSDCAMKFAIVLADTSAQYNNQTGANTLPC